MSREMKDSGVEWIGEIPKDWKVKKLKRIGKFSSSGIDKKINQNEVPVKIVNYVDVYRDIKHELFNSDEYMVVTTVQEKIDKHCLKKGDLVFTPSSETIEDIGISSLVREDLDNTAFSYHLLRFEFNIDIYENYKKYLCNNYYVRNYYSKCATGTIRKTLSRNDFELTEVLLPSFLEQQKIANFLDEKVGQIDRLIDNAKKGIEEYKKYKQSIITEAVTKGLDPNVEMKDSGIEWIGEIPKNWEFRKIKSFSDIISKGTTPKEMSTIKDSKYTIRYIKSENIVDDELIDKPEFYITNDVNEELKRSQLTDKDILFVIAGASIGKVAIMEGDLLPANTNQAISFIRIKDEYLIYKKYLWYFLQSNIIKVVINLYSVQSAQPNLSMENIGNIKISFPFYKNDINEIIEYLDNKCYEIENLIFKKEKLISELESYKKFLIYEYVTGKKEVL